MRSERVFILSILILFSRGTGRAAAAAGPAAGRPAAVKFADDAPPAPKFSAAQLARVGGWLREFAPSAPPAAVAAAAQHFLEDLQWQHPEQMQSLLTDAFPKKSFDSSLLRHLAAQLGGAPQAALRQELAVRRVQVLLARGGGPVPDAAALIVKLKGISDVYYRRLVEGRIEDDDLEPLFAEAGRVSRTAVGAQAPSAPLALSVGDILADFSRQNQSGSAADAIRAFSVDGTLKLPNGEEQHLRLFKLRPDRFRLHVLVGETTRYILAHDGTRFWQETAGGKPQTVSENALGPRRYLCEFLNPLFGDQQGYTFTRLEDGTLDGRKVYRIAVHRADDSQYVADIDPATFHEVAGEYDKGVRVRYSDFRQVAGLTMAFREETTDAAGHEDVFQLTQFTANPGLIPEFFNAPVEGRDLGYLALEQLVAHATKRPPLSKN